MQNTDPLILVTNDDGVYAPGIQALFEAMKSVGRPVMVVTGSKKTWHKPAKIIISRVC